MILNPSKLKIIGGKYSSNTLIIAGILVLFSNNIFTGEAAVNTNPVAIEIQFTDSINVVDATFGWTVRVREQGELEYERQSDKVKQPQGGVSEDSQGIKIDHKTVDALRATLSRTKAAVVLDLGIQGDENNIIILGAGGTHCACLDIKVHLENDDFILHLNSPFDNSWSVDMLSTMKLSDLAHLFSINLDDIQEREKFLRAWTAEAHKLRIVMELITQLPIANYMFFLGSEGVDNQRFKRFASAYIAADVAVAKIKEYDDKKPAVVAPVKSK